MTTAQVTNASKIMAGATAVSEMCVGDTYVYSKDKVWIKLGDIGDPYISSSVPIYKIGVKDIQNEYGFCRVGFTKQAGLANMDGDPDGPFPSRLWYSGDNTNKVSIHYQHGNSIYNQPENYYPPGDDTGWLPYSDIHKEHSVILNNGQYIDDVWVYNCLNGRYNSRDDEWNNPLYLYFYQSNSPLDHFYVLIDKVNVPSQIS